MAPKSSEVYVIDEHNSFNEDINKKLDYYEKEYKFEEALDIIGFGKVQIAALIVCGLILMAVICETMGMMIILIAAQCDLSLVTYQKGLLSGVSFFGILISSYLWGYLADTHGRKKIILYSSFVAVLFSFLSTLTNNFWGFLILRLFCGISISGPSATIYAYLGEFNNTKNRQTTISWASIFVGLAATFMPGIAWLLLPQSWSLPLYEGMHFRPWQLVVMIYSLPGLLGAILIWFLPESPKFLLSQNREREAYQIMEWIYVKNTGKPAHSFVVQKLDSEADKEYLENLNQKKECLHILQSMWNQTVPLFRKPHFGNILICSIAQFGIFFSSSGMGLWFPEIQNRVNSMDENDSFTVCEVIEFTENKLYNTSIGSQICDDTVNPKVYVDSMALGASYILGYTILAILINPIGRRIILPALLLSSGICGVLLIWINQRTAVVLLFCGYLMLSGLCISIVNGAIVDLIPTHLRGMAVCIQLSMGRLGSIVGSNVVGWLLYKNCYITFSFYSGFVIFCALLVVLLPNRTK